MQLDLRENEQARLSALDRYDILDTPSEEAFDRITRVVRSVLQVPIAMVNFIDGHRVWFKSHPGMSATEGPREVSICKLTIQQTRALVVPDTVLDRRFAQEPFVLGEPYVRFYAGVPLRSRSGHNIGTLCALDSKPRMLEDGQVQTLVDLADIVMDELEFRNQASIDGLTGVLSRRAFRDEAERAFALARRHGHDLSCITFDLDHFKHINDSNGHDAGDAVLVESARACLSELRKSDLLGRMGGEEFAVVLPHTGRSAALSVAEKMRRAISGLSFAGRSEDMTVTASFGVASVDRSTADFHTLLKRADLALYSAKGEGRNRCAVSDPVEAINPQIRRRVLKAGRIFFNLGRSTIDCTVRSLSDSSAGIDVSSTAGIPDEFKLHIETDDMSRACRIVTKRDKHIEVDFI
jgi:diguanylate cyclase (GGDEF)-like protein